jgi:probable rRNA maturation factor
MIKVNVKINNKSWRKKINSPNKYFKKKLKKIYSIVKFFHNKNVSFSILLTNAINIKKLNKEFRNQNKPTDVLSFPYFTLKSLKSNKLKNFYLGDVAICYEVIKTRSQKKNFILEFDKAWIHGLLHLIGYDHIKNKDYNKMSKMEKKILNSIY